MSVPDLLVVGDVNPDLILSGGDVEPAFGQAERLVEHADLVLGGSGAITASGAARLGLEVGMCGVVGDDDLGRRCVRLLADAGIEVSAVRVTPGVPTGITVILARDGDRAILTAPGAIRELGRDDLEGLPDAPAHHVHVASYFLMSESFREGLPATLRRLRAAGVTTSLDTNWDPSERWDLGGLLDEVDLLLPNEAELSALTGGLATDDALRTFDQRPAVAVKLGAGGGAIRRGESIVRVDAPAPTRFVDSVGAGDSFDAGYLAGMLAGRGPADSLAMAVAAGSLSTREAGGTAGQPDRAEVRRLAATLG